MHHRPASRMGHTGAERERLLDSEVSPGRYGHHFRILSSHTLLEPSSRPLESTDRRILSRFRDLTSPLSDGRFSDDHRCIHLWCLEAAFHCTTFYPEAPELSTWPGGIAAQRTGQTPAQPQSTSKPHPNSRSFAASGPDVML
jgi:hypothetical protein